MKLKNGFALKSGVAALALSLLAGNAWGAACARPDEMSALMTAALQQQLMVAALTCRDTQAYNRFVLSYRDELQKSDHTLLNFFTRSDAQRGDDNYNAYKTKLANLAALRSLNDPRFCGSANAAFDVALKHASSLNELVSQRQAPTAIGYTSCSSDRPNPTLAYATPNLPARHQLLDDRAPRNAASGAEPMPVADDNDRSDDGFRAQGQAEDRDGSSYADDQPAEPAYDNRSYADDRRGYNPPPYGYSYAPPPRQRAPRQSYGRYYSPYGY